MADEISERQLLSRLAPEGSWGDLVGILATTYELDALFFDEEWLPTVAGIKAHNDRSRRGRVELERALAGAEAAVLLVDARPYRQRPRSMRVEVCAGVGEGRRLQHAKISVLVYDRAVRVTIGSANLTRAGYRENREIVGILTATAAEPGDAAAILELLDALPDALGEWWGPSQFAGAVVALARARVQTWAALPAPSSAQLTPAVSGRGPALWERMLDRWGDRPIRDIVVASPFWSCEAGAFKAVIRFVEDLDRRGQLAKGATLQLRCERIVLPTGERRPDLPSALAAWSPPAGVTGEAVPVDARVLPVEVNGRTDFEGVRRLHAKVVVVSDGERAIAYCGSANFTAQGWGFHASRRNAEAGFFLEGTARQLATLLPPIDRGGSVVVLGTGVIGEPMPEPDEPSEDDWPTFLRDVRLCHDESGTRLELLVDQAPATAGSWSLCAPPLEALSPILEHLAGEPVRRAIPVAAEQLATLLSHGCVYFRRASADQARAIPLNVDAALRERLPLRIGGGDPEEALLLAYYLGRLDWGEVVEGDEVEDWLEGEDPTPVSRLGSVDTSSIQTYQMRVFIDALPGLRDDLARASRAPSAMRIAVLGPVSPVALARHVAGHASRSRTAKAFQLVEILAAIVAAGCLDVQADHRARWAGATGEARAEVESLLSGVAPATDEFRQFQRAVLARADGTSA